VQTKPKNIQAVLRKITKSYKMCPYSINCGWCDLWADDVSGVLRRLGHDVEVWETDFEKADFCHVFVRIDGKFYDAEERDGVDDYMKLPIFRRLFKVIPRRQPVDVVG